MSFGISLTFDDALPEHLDHVVPILDEYGLKGTFYCHLSALSFSARLDDWKHVAKAGHELGNHTVFHPAMASKSWVRPGNAIDHYSVDRMEMELGLANQWLTSIDGESLRTFAYPCSNSRVGHAGWVRGLLRKVSMDRTRIAGWVDRFGIDFGQTYESYESSVSRLFIAARGGGLTERSVPPSLDCFSRWRLPSVSVEGWTESQMIEYAERGMAQGTWTIFQFHGVGGGHHQDCEQNAFRGFCRWLARDSGTQVHTIRDGAMKRWGNQRNE